MELREQVEAVRSSGAVNMFDSQGVQAVAEEMGLHELVEFIESDRDEYLRYIMTGDADHLRGSRC